MKLPKWSQWAVLVLVGVVLLFAGACAPGNNPPQISSVSADPVNLAPGEISTLTCVATDPDGDTLTYSWKYSGPCEAAILETGSTVDWTVAGALGTYTVTVTVNDGKGGTAEGSCSVTVEVLVTAGSIDVKSSPAGATVYIDGTDTGNITPYVITDIDEGDHTIKLALTEHKDKEGTVTVNAGETTYINWQLEEAEMITATIQPGSADGEDTYVYLANPGNTHGSEPFVFAGAGIGNEICRLYLQFDLNAIPTTAVVTNAELGLYYLNSVGTGAAPIGAYSVTSSWDEDTMDWLGQPNSAETSEDINTVPAAVTLDWEYWYIEELVQGWVNGSIENHGVLLKDTDEATEKAYKAFYSSNWGTAAQRPKLVITYYEP